MFPRIDLYLELRYLPGPFVMSLDLETPRFKDLLRRMNLEP